MLLKNFLLVALGGLIGSVLRYAVALLFKNSSFPYATLCVNIAGCFIIGLVIGASLKSPALHHEWKLFLATGLCGGFTTFSAFAYENVSFLRSGHFGYFFLYVAASLLFGIFATYLGLIMVK